MKKVFCLIFIFLCVRCSINANSVIADSLNNSGNFYEAAIGYDYIIYSGTDISEINEMRLKKSECYKHLSLFKKAAAEMDKVNYAMITDSLFSKYHYQATLCSYLSGDFNSSLFHTDQIILNSPDKKIYPVVYLIRALCFNNLYLWNQAKEAAMLYCDLNFPPKESVILKKSIDSIYNPKRTPKIKTENRLKYFKLIPGFGQAYCGYYKEGALNFLLSALALTAGSIEFYYHFYITGYCIAVIPINKFYFGSHNRAELLLNKHNYYEVLRFNEKVKSILIKY